MNALRAGASGYLRKQYAPQELVRAVRKVCAGGKYISPALAEIMAERLEDPEDRLPRQALPHRELEAWSVWRPGENSTKIALGIRLSIKR